MSALFFSFIIIRLICMTKKCWRIVMYIRCKRCGYKETINKRFFFKILGGAVSGFGFYAWVAYIFVGTGLALPICCAIVAG